MRLHLEYDVVSRQGIGRELIGDRERTNVEWTTLEEVLDIGDAKRCG